LSEERNQGKARTVLLVRTDAKREKTTKTMALSPAGGQVHGCDWLVTLLEEPPTLHKQTQKGTETI